jgi:hypothetical protein
MYVFLSSRRTPDRVRGRRRNPVFSTGYKFTGLRVEFIPMKIGTGVKTFYEAINYQKTKLILKPAF